MNESLKLLDSIESLDYTQKIEEAFPVELKQIFNKTAASQRQQIGDYLAKAGVSLEDTDFGNAESDISNRDPRLKDSNYIVLILREGRISLLFKGTIQVGDVYDFSTMSWTKFMAGAKAWFITKAEASSSTELRNLRAQLKDGAIALKAESGRASYEKSIKQYKDSIESTISYLTKNPDDTYYQEYLDRQSKMMDEFIRTHDKNTGEYLKNLSDYRTKLAAIKLAKESNAFDELDKSGKLIENIYDWISKKQEDQKELFIKGFAKGDPEKWYSRNPNEKSVRAFDSSLDLVLDMMRLVGRLMKNGYLSDSDKKSVVELLAE